MSGRKYEFYTRLMLVGAAAILVAMALLHGSGFFQVGELLRQPAIPEPWSAGMRAVWLLYSAHLVLLAAILTYAAIRRHAIAAPLLMLCGLFPALDALLLLVYVGGFLGNGLLALAAVLIFGAVARGTTPLAT